MNENEAKLLNELLKQALKARIACNHLRFQAKSLFGASSIHALSTEQQQKRLDQLVADAPMPPSLADVAPEDMRDVAMKFLAEATQFLSRNSDVINSTETEASQQLRAIEAQLDSVAAAIVQLKEKLNEPPSPGVTPDA